MTIEKAVSSLKNKYFSLEINDVRVDVLDSENNWITYLDYFDDFDSEEDCADDIFFFCKVANECSTELETANFLAYQFGVIVRADITKERAYELFGDDYTNMIGNIPIIVRE